MFRRLAAVWILASAVTANAQSPPSTPADCLFNWAETTYPHLFSPAGAPSSTVRQYYYRYYPQTNSYLGTSPVDNDVYYLGPAPNNSVLKAGALSGWLAIAGCQYPFRGYTFDAPSLAISNALMGVPDDGSQRAGVNPASMITPTGQVRLVFGGPNNVMWSAMSSDGVTFTVDQNFRGCPFTDCGVGHLTIAASPTGGYRMFGRAGTKVYSATSVDGAVWTQEAGVRFDAAAMGLTSISGAPVVRLPNGQYRMYFSQNEPTNCPQPNVSNSIYSASSPDQLTWTADAGVRLGDDIDSRCKNKPHAIVEPDGSITLFYHVYSRARAYGSTDPYMSMVFYSNSTDGLTFTAQTATGLGFTTPTSGGLTQSSDPNILAMPDGTVRLYFDVFRPPNGDQVYVSSGRRN